MFNDWMFVEEQVPRGVHRLNYFHIADVDDRLVPCKKHGRARELFAAQQFIDQLHQRHPRIIVPYQLFVGLNQVEPVAYDRQRLADHSYFIQLLCVEAVCEYHLDTPGVEEVSRCHADRGFYS